MGKKILSGIFVLVLLASSAYGVSKSITNSTNLRNLASNNIEALAQNLKTTSTHCTGSYYVCVSEFNDFIDEMNQNCDTADIEVELLPEC